METFGRDLSDKLYAEFIGAVHSRDAVSGLTHEFYRYPARFSPQFANAAIKSFTAPGDLVLDPFMGAGTTLVEARVQGRHAIGTDISSLAVFLAKVKTTVLSDSQIESAYLWADDLDSVLNCHQPSIRSERWIDKGYQRNVSGKKTWPIRKLLEQAIGYSKNIKDQQVEDFTRCALLKTGQWALDCKEKIPSAERFREQLKLNMAEMCEQAKKFAASVREVDTSHDDHAPFRIRCLHRSAADLDTKHLPEQVGAPKLILTSPPYPGVHVLYHRWQVRGRRETPAPFWLANRRDGQGGSYYTMGGRHQEGLPKYFKQASEIFSSLVRIADPSTLFVQMIAFSEPSWQLQKYLDVLEQTGLVEEKLDRLASSPDGRLWRDVPNRKWYADQKGRTESSKEVVLFHRLA